MNNEPIEPSKDDLRYDALWDLSKEELVRKLMDCQDAFAATDDEMQELINEIAQLQMKYEPHRFRGNKEDQPVLRQNPNKS